MQSTIQGYCFDCKKQHAYRRVIAYCPFCGEEMKYCNPGFVDTTWRCYNHPHYEPVYLMCGLPWPGKYERVQYKSFYLGEEVRVDGVTKKVPASGWIPECKSGEAR